MTETANEPVYFWQETHSELGYLSQWYYCPFRDDKDPSIVYKTAEQYVDIPSPKFFYLDDV